MMPASSTAGGTCFALPDACLTPAPPAPPVPVPYPNTAQVAQAQSFCTKVCIENKEALTLQSKIPRSQGDEAGVNGGVMSGVFGDQVTYKKGSDKVFFGGAAAVMVTSPTGHNGASANAPSGMQVAPSQTKVMVSP